MAITLPKGSLITVAGTTLSDHNRTALQIDNEAGKTDVRLVNFGMKRYFVATKKKLSFSWSMLPALDSRTADGKAGRNTLRSLYDANMDNTVVVTYYEVNASNVQTLVTLTCFIDDYSETLSKRFDTQYWECSLSLVEQ